MIISIKMWCCFLVVLTAVLLFFIISHKSKIARISFEKQRLEKEYAGALKQKSKLEQELAALYDNDKIYHLAQTKLGMEKIKLSQVHSLMPRQV